LADIIIYRLMLNGFDVSKIKNRIPVSRIPCLNITRCDHSKTPLSSVSVLVCPVWELMLVLPDFSVFPLLLYLANYPTVFVALIRSTDCHSH
jgi:hypothetical protein